MNALIVLPAKSQRHLSSVCDGNTTPARRAAEEQASYDAHGSDSAVRFTRLITWASACLSTFSRRRQGRVESGKEHSAGMSVGCNDVEFRGSELPLKNGC